MCVPGTKRPCYSDKIRPGTAASVELLGLAASGHPADVCGQACARASCCHLFAHTPRSPYIRDECGLRARVKAQDREMSTGWRGTAATLRRKRSLPQRALRAVLDLHADGHAACAGDSDVAAFADGRVDVVGHRAQHGLQAVDGPAFAASTSTGDGRGHPRAATAVSLMFRPGGDRLCRARPWSGDQ